MGEEEEEEEGIQACFCMTLKQERNVSTLGRVWFLQRQSTENIHAH